MSLPAAAVPLREIGLAALFAFAVYMLLAIGSYSPLDPAWTFSGSDLSVSNWVGQSGAYTADVMLWLFGWPAYLLPACLLIAALRLLRRGVAASAAQALIRAAGFCALLIAACVLAQLHFVGDGLRAGTGGALGAGIVKAGLPLLNWLGLTLCALVLLSIGSQAAFGYSWLSVAERTGRGVYAFAGLLLSSASAVGRLAAAGAGRTTGTVRQRRQPQQASSQQSAAEVIRSNAPPAAKVEPRVGGVESEPLASRDEPPNEDPLDALMAAAEAVPVAAARESAAEAPAAAAPEGRPDAASAEFAELPEELPAMPAEATPTAVEAATPPAPEESAPPPAAEPAQRSASPSVYHRPVLELPALDLLEEYDGDASGGYSQESLEDMSQLLESKLADFRVDAKVVSVLAGPVVTRFELQPAAGVKVSKFTSLAKDLARSLAVVSVRIVEIIPGKSVVGIEIPNERRETVRLKEILDSRQYRNARSPLTLALGKDIAGTPVMADIGKMPHLLVAGTTGSGKSVGINAMLLSMLYKAKPEDLRLILVDPKMLELSVYDDIPHLLTPVVTDMKDAAQALNWCVGEMERRYRLMAALGVRNLAGYNRQVEDASATDKPLLDPLWPQDAGEPAPALQRLPFIVVVIDEFADMMMIVGKKVEQLIARIAQKARAAGIHLLLATQRPSVDVITGLIKANIPARMAFQVSSKVDSRTILDQGGADQLLGHGDMLFLPPGTSMPVRVHGAFVSDEEVHAVAADWKARGEPEFVADLLAGVPAEAEVPGTVDLSGDTESDEPLYDEAVAFVLETRRASISSVQRKLRIGYNRAARLIEAMEQAGVVSPMNGSGGREVLAPSGPGD